MADLLPGLLSSHTSATMHDAPGETHHLIPLGPKQVLEWTEQSGHYDLWLCHPFASGNPFPDPPQATGTFATIRDG